MMENSFKITPSLVDDKELSQLYYLRKEGERLRREIEGLRARLEYKSPGLSDTARCSSRPDFTDQIAELADLEAILRANLSRADRERVRLENFIESIPDSEMRLIFRLRHINCMSWESIGLEVHSSRMTVRRKYKKYLATGA